MLPKEVICYYIIDDATFSRTYLNNIIHGWIIDKSMEDMNCTANEFGIAQSIIFCVWKTSEMLGTALERWIVIAQGKQ